MSSKVWDELIIHSQTLTAAPLKSGAGLVTFSYTLNNDGYTYLSMLLKGTPGYQLIWYVYKMNILGMSSHDGFGIWMAFRDRK